MIIGILKEGKTPPDKRVPLTPEQCADIQQKYGVEVRVQSSGIRCFDDAEYSNLGVRIVQDLSSCDVLLGVKEVPINQLLEGKTYFFFSHTIKKQSYNRKLLQAVLAKNIRLIDWETLTDAKGERLIAFGRFAGMVGAHNALYTWGKRTADFDLPRMIDCADYEDAKSIYASLSIPPIKIILTGTGRVANGSAEVLQDMGIRKVSKEAFLTETFESPVFAQLGVQDYVRHKHKDTFENQEFYEFPQQFETTFEPYSSIADIFINGIYWDNKAPVFFTLKQMTDEQFHIKVIADVTCDIAPVSSVPSTIRPSTIADPVYGFNPRLNAETEPYQTSAVDVMAIDNLPNELPRDASKAFGEQFMTAILGELIKHEQSEILTKATIARNGGLTPAFQYLQSFVEENMD